MVDWFIALLMILGSLFVLISVIGLLRLPDLYMRMHASTKTTSFGVVMILLGAVLALPNLETIIKGLLVIIFIFLTSPLGAHMISKAGHILNIKKTDTYFRDDLSDR